MNDKPLSSVELGHAAERAIDAGDADTARFFVRRMARRLHEYEREAVRLEALLDAELSADGATEFRKFCREMAAQPVTDWREGSALIL